MLDTQVYSNTGGQASKATPRAAVAKFAVGGKAVPRKDLGMIASAYGNVYVAQVALAHRHPFQLDSRAPTLPLRELTASEARFAMLERSDPERSGRLLALAQADADERWRWYEQRARVERTEVVAPGAAAAASTAVPDPADGSADGAEEAP